MARSAPGRVPVHPLLIAAYAVLSVYAANLDEVLPTDLVVPLGRVLIVAGTVLAVAALFLRDYPRGAIVATAGLIPAAFLGHLSPQLASLGIDEGAQLVAFGVALIASAVYAVRARGSLAPVTLVFNAFSGALVVMSLVAIVPYEVGRAQPPSGAASAADVPVATATRVPDRDIYLIVLDRYGSNWSIEHRFRIADNDLPSWLAGQGFQVLPGARANYRATDFSLSSTLSMRMLDDLTTSEGTSSGDRTPARARLVRPEVGVFLRANGYRYYQLGSWFGPTQTNQIADEVLTYGQDTEFGTVLREASILPALDRLIGTGPMDDAFRDQDRGIALFQFRQLQRLASVPGRKFVFAHILKPHPPYVFRADGSRILVAEARATPEEDLFRGQLAFTNERVKEVVSALLAGPDGSDPIIIIKGDEGPFLCHNVDCVDGTPNTFGIRFGVLAAYYLPGLPPDVFPPDHTSVNDFRTILREYFGADLPDLPDRSFNWPDNDHVYDFQDVTDMLPLPGS